MPLTLTIDTHESYSSFLEWFNELQKKYSRYKFDVTTDEYDVTRISINWYDTVLAEVEFWPESKDDSFHEDLIKLNLAAVKQPYERITIGNRDEIIPNFAALFFNQLNRQVKTESWDVKGATYVTSRRLTLQEYNNLNQVLQKWIIEVRASQDDDEVTVKYKYNLLEWTSADWTWMWTKVLYEHDSVDEDSAWVVTLDETGEIVYDQIPFPYDNWEDPLNPFDDVRNDLLIKLTPLLPKINHHPYQPEVNQVPDNINIDPNSKEGLVQRYYELKKGYKKLTQEQASSELGVSRATLQRALLEVEGPKRQKRGNR